MKIQTDSWEAPDQLGTGLCLTRRPRPGYSRVHLDVPAGFAGRITVAVVEVRGQAVRLCVDAPGVAVVREEAERKGT